jgi:hypothetical protein
MRSLSIRHADTKLGQYIFDVIRSARSDSVAEIKYILSPFSGGART